MARGTSQLLGTAIRYFVNAVNLARQQQGWRSAATTAISLSTEETRKIPRLLKLRWNNRAQQARPSSQAASLDATEILPQLADLAIEVRTATVDREAFTHHMRTFAYPRFYAGGSVTSGGVREAKILEYFVSLNLLPIENSDVAIDIASERSIFPEMIHETIGARVFRQDLIYPLGVHDDRIGGSAHEMPIVGAFADKLFLHNSFEHFEGDTDTKFIYEAWRVLKPGGGACIIPLYLSTRHQNLTDPLLGSDGVVWDAEAEIVQRVGHHNRFGRFYSPRTLSERVLEPASERGFEVNIYHFPATEPGSVDPLNRALGGLRFAMVLRKPLSAHATDVQVELSL
jgi:SAM-dependent methyltransferase